MKGKSPPTSEKNQFHLVGFTLNGYNSNGYHSKINIIYMAYYLTACKSSSEKH